MTEDRETIQSIINSGVHVSWTYDKEEMRLLKFALWQSIKAKLESLSIDSLRALPLTGHVFISLPDGAPWLPTPAAVHILHSPLVDTGWIDKTERDLSAEFFGAFSYCLMELTPPGIEPEEEEAAFSPNWPQFLAMSREEMIAFLAAYVSQIDYIES
jgi:hypothetical protein